MGKRIKVLTLPIIFALLLIVFFTISIIFLDPDFGWHIKMGELISTSGIPQTDPFSYTMPSFPFIDHEWLTDLIIFKLYTTLGYFGLAFISATMVSLTILMVSPTKITPTSLALITISAALLLTSAGSRPQIISWFMFALLCRILFASHWWEKTRLILPLLFFIWVNLHGGFALGIAISFIFLFFKWREKTATKTDLAVIILSFFATLINPYGFRIWEEIFRTGFDASLRWSIAEWAPAFSTVDVVLIIFMAFSLALVWFYQRKLSSFQRTIYLILLLAALSSKRQVPFWVIFNLPLTIQLGEKLLLKAADRLRLERMFLFTAFALFWAQATILFSTAQVWSENNAYPGQAITYLQNHTYQGHLFAPYDWGGYLIWRLPESKTFVDGRMPSWKQLASNKNESTNAYGDYRRIIFLVTDPETVFKQYNIHTVLWKTGEINSQFIQKLVQDGWENVYQDQISVILTKG